MQFLYRKIPQCMQIVEIVKRLDFEYILYFVYIKILKLEMGKSF